MTLESHRTGTCSVDAVVEATESHGWVSETEAEGTLKHLLNAYCEVERDVVEVTDEYGWRLEHEHISDRSEGDSHKVLKLQAAIFLNGIGHKLHTVEVENPIQTQFESRDWVFTGSNFEIRSGPVSIRPDVGCPECATYVEVGNTPAKRVRDYIIDTHTDVLYLLPFGKSKFIEPMVRSQIELFKIDIRRDQNTG